MKINKSKSISQIGVEITDVDISKKLNSSDLKNIHSSWVESCVAIFPNQRLSHDEFSNFAQQFGGFGEESFLSTMDTQPNIVELRRKPDELSAPFGGSWHSDWSFQSSPPSATMLHSKIIPPYGGDTLFSNSALAYEDLSDELKQEVKNLKAIHSAKLPYADDGFYALEKEVRTMQITTSTKANETQTHPVIRVHPDTRRKSLFINPVYTIGIEGMSDNHAYALLAKLFDHMGQEKYIYRHTWKPNMLIMWDNRSVMHLAEGGYDGHERLMHRITISGETPILST